MNDAGKLLPVFLPICADWWMPLLPMLMASMNMSKDRETSIKALEDSVNGRSVPPLETMTIRQYCKYFRIAHEVYESFYRN